MQITTINRSGCVVDDATVFYRMAWLDMNTYIYAPKDDLKHRMHWRDLYTVDEAGNCLLGTVCILLAVKYCCILLSNINHI